MPIPLSRPLPFRVGSVVALYDDPVECRHRVGTGVVRRIARTRLDCFVVSCWVRLPGETVDRHRWVNVEHWRP